MELQFIIDRQSKWEFVTSGTGGVAGGGGLVGGVSGGVLVFKDLTGKEANFKYGGVGAGVGAGAKFKLGKINIKAPKVGGSVAPTTFPSKGILYLTPTMNGKEPTTSDFQGPCIFIEAAAGLIFGLGGVIMLLGIDPISLVMMGLPGGQGAALKYMFDSAKLALLMAAPSAGVQAGASIMGYVGGVI